jgi:ornithine carbamoyltransferase
MRHFLTLFDVTRDEIQMLLQEAARMKAVQERGERSRALAGKVLGLIFEKPSLRTRASFETAMAHLGGSSIFLPGNETGLGQRETVPDFARTLSEYVDGIVLRTFAQETIETFAAHATCAVINGLSDSYHPCQALGDLLTVQELFGKVEGRTLAFIGDGNNVARSLAVACGKVGMRFILAAPDGYGFDEPFLQKLRKEVPGGDVVTKSKPGPAVRSADVIYTDVWASMGQEAEREQRKKAFAPFQVNAALLAQAPKHARFMHCLPAKREEEVTSDVLDGERSVVFQQAGNRMHAQKALLKWLLS